MEHKPNLNFNNKEKQTSDITLNNNININNKNINNTLSSFSPLYDVSDIYISNKKSKRQTNTTYLKTNNPKSFITINKNTILNSDKYYKVSGQIYISQDNYGYVYNNIINQNIFVSSGIIKRYNLKDGDIINGIFSINQETGLYFMVHII